MESNRAINKELLDDRKRLESEVKLLILGMFFFCCCCCCGLKGCVAVVGISD